MLNIALSSPFGQALFEAPAARSPSSSGAPIELVPAGREGEFVDMESELEDLLWQR